ncbi:hypothetical protein HRI_001571500 [Hibiscus trionum]|uniref:Uncharacterized protein n=1 Tax=Hibiscus trionum TaxID=183268 RepID=A0A9W7LVC0_HIBTR|nr:hypothetical protein HRI_001571500 [Hibiscus trionum]
MDNEDSNEEETASLLHVNEMFLRKILSRNSSSDNSVCIPYRRSIGVVPFQWELEPGTPKHHLMPEKEIVSPVKPLSRTTSRMSHEINKQCINEERESRSWFWRKSRKFSQGDIKGKDKAKSKGNIGFEYYSRSFSSTSSRVTSSRLRSFAKKWTKWPF